MINRILWNVEKKMEASVEAFKRELDAIRTGHASPALIEHLKVEYAGTPLPLNQLASISAPEVRLLSIQPWDKSSIHSIEKAILKSDLGLNPTSDGNIIRINIPPLSAERRQELVKAVRSRVEKERIIIRNLRRETMDELKKLEKNKEISQDELKRALDQLQKLTDSFIAAAEKVGINKEVQLTEV